MKANTMFLAIFILASMLLNAQTPDSIQTIPSQAERMEFIAERTDRQLDYADLADILLYYRENPLNINLAGKDEIQSLQILDPVTVYKFLEYRDKYGSILTVYELLAIDGFNKETIQNLLPYISLGATGVTGLIKPTHRRFKYELIGRYSRILEKQKGFFIIPVQEWEQHPNERYIGTADRFYVKSSLSWNKKVRLGFTLDKDAGEAMFPDNLPDTISDAIKTELPIGFDFFSGYAYAQDMLFIKKIVLGDYHLQFGQGLCMWSGMSYGKSADVINIKRYAAMIRPNTSANENSYMRGGAAWLQFGPVGITAFYSNHKADANIIENDDAVKYVSSLQTSGYHRTLNEVRDKHALQIINYGGRIHFDHQQFKIGLTGHITRFDAILQKEDQIHNRFKTQGRDFFNAGFDFDFLVFRNTNIFGEIASDQKRSIAFMAGLVSLLHPKVSISMIYRKYRPDHSNLYGNAFSEAGTTQNETGFYIGISLNPFSNIILKAYADFYRFPWIKYRVDAPSSGFDMLVQLNYILSPTAQMYLRYRTESRQQNHPDLIAYIDPLIERTKHIIRFHVAYQVSASLQLRNRVEWNTAYCYHQNGIINNESLSGFLIYQDFIYKPPSKPYQLIIRLALFDTDDYETRVYAYENDVLYASSVPAYYGQGTRIYLVGKIKIARFLDLWLKLAQTYYYDRNIIGTGLDQIQGKTKSEIRLQFRIKI